MSINLNLSTSMVGFSDTDIHWIWIFKQLLQPLADDHRDDDHVI